MRVLATAFNFVRRLAMVVWGGLGMLAIYGYFTQVGDGLRERGVRSFFGNLLGLFVVFVAPLSLVSLAARRLR